MPGANSGSVTKISAINGAGLWVRRHRDGRVDAEVGERSATVDAWKELDLRGAGLRWRGEVDDKPADLTWADIVGRLDAGARTIGEGEGRLRAVDPPIPADGAGVAERDDPLDRFTRARLRERRLRYERCAICAERREVETPPPKPRAPGGR